MSAQFEEDKMMDTKDTIIVNQYSLASCYVEVFLMKLNCRMQPAFLQKEMGQGI